MADITVVGSGPSGVHFAETALDKGHTVTMFDVGHTRDAQPFPDRTFRELKYETPGGPDYLLGKDFGGTILPSFDDEFYGLPPSKDHVLRGVPDFTPTLAGMEPLFSFARGGLAEVWTAGCYPFNDAELTDFPFGWEDLSPHYATVAARIGVTGEEDDLARFLPVHDHLEPGIPLDEHSASLIARYQRKRGYLNRRLRTAVGRTRVATLSRDRPERQACTRLGRCLWGCPHEALYTPSLTLRALLQRPGFTYRPGQLAERFLTDENGAVTDLECRDLKTGNSVTHRVQDLVLAAGALNTTGIVLRSIESITGERIRLSGLMDNRQVLVPFLNFRMLGKTPDYGTYQYHLLGLGIERDDPREYIHGQITTLKAAMLHPVIQQLPFDLRTSTFVMRNIHTALGVVNLNFHDTRRDTNYVTLDGGGSGQLHITYEPASTEGQLLKAGISTTRRALRALGCYAPPPMIHIRPMGASVHYAGTLPMTSNNDPWTTDQYGRVRGFRNVVIADGATFPFLPAKNLTFTLMANATRIAEALY